MIHCLFVSFYICWSVNDVNRMDQNQFPIMGEFSGFTHKSEEGDWFLTDQPNLQSCCQAAPNESQVLFLSTRDPLDEKRLYKFEGSVRLEGSRKILEGVKLKVKSIGFLHLFTLLGIVLILSGLALKKGGILSRYIQQKTPASSSKEKELE